MAIFSIKDTYPEAKSWESLSSTVAGDANVIVRIFEIWTHDGAHFVDAVVIDCFANRAEFKRLIDFS